jgi:hypothetical protein
MFGSVLGDTSQVGFDDVIAVQEWQLPGGLDPDLRGGQRFLGEGQRDGILPSCCLPPLRSKTTSYSLLSVSARTCSPFLLVWHLDHSKRGNAKAYPIPRFQPFQLDHLGAPPPPKSLSRNPLGEALK